MHDALYSDESINETVLFAGLDRAATFFSCYNRARTLAVVARPNVGLIAVHVLLQSEPRHAPRSYAASAHVSAAAPSRRISFWTMFEHPKRKHDFSDALCGRLRRVTSSSMLARVWVLVAATVLCTQGC